MPFFHSFHPPVSFRHASFFTSTVPISGQYTGIHGFSLPRVKTAGKGPGHLPTIARCLVPYHHRSPICFRRLLVRNSPERSRLKCAQYMVVSESKRHSPDPYSCRPRPQRNGGETTPDDPHRNRCPWVPHRINTNINLAPLQKRGQALLWKPTPR